jgi:hypothetical protein
MTRKDIPVAHFVRGGSENGLEHDESLSSERARTFPVDRIATYDFGSHGSYYNIPWLREITRTSIATDTPIQTVDEYC